MNSAAPTAKHQLNQLKINTAELEQSQDRLIEAFRQAGVSFAEFNEAVIVFVEEHIEANINQRMFADWDRLIVEYGRMSDDAPAIETKRKPKPHYHRFRSRKRQRWL